MFSRVTSRCTHPTQQLTTTLFNSEAITPETTIRVCFDEVWFEKEAKIVFFGDVDLGQKFHQVVAGGKARLLPKVSVP